jgi:hypothetical protein
VTHISHTRAQVLSALSAHFGASLSLRHLDLSRNELGARGSRALVHFLASIKGVSGGVLTWLDASDAALDMELLTPVFGVVNTLEWLDVSDNAAVPACVGGLCALVMPSQASHACACVTARVVTRIAHARARWHEALWRRCQGV